MTDGNSEGRLMTIFGDAQVKNFAHSRVDQMEADMLRTRMCYE